MERQILRTIAIMVVIAALGGVLMVNRAGRLRRAQDAARAAAVEDSARAAAANPDSARIVRAAVAAYDADRRARGLEPLAVRVLQVAVDAQGALVTLIPVRLVPDAEATVRVRRDGSARLVAR